MKARVDYDFEAQEDNELSVKEGDIVEIIEDDKGGKNKNAM